MTDTGPLEVNPDCRDGKHAACAGDAWDLEHDMPTTCKCWCHQEGAEFLMGLGRATVESIVRAATVPGPDRRERRKQERKARKS